MDTQDQIYRDLQKHLDTGPSGFRAAASGVEILLLKRLLTPEEAKIATQISTIKLEPAKTIHKRLKKIGMSMPIEELQKKLDQMVYKGTLLVYKEGFKEKRYKNPGGGGGGMIDFQVNRLSKELVDDLDRYHQEGFSGEQTIRTTRRPSVAGLRTIPVEKSVPLPEKYLVRTYDDARKLVENSPGPFSVANCVCRQMRDIRGQSCKYSDIRETCLQIGPDHARQYVEMGIGRFITREEAFDVLGKAEQAGFILMPENSQRPENICCCCGDCCGVLGAMLRSPRPVERFTSNYYAEVDSEVCTGCGTCVKRCQLEARVMVDGKATIILDRCIGCGNCVVTCTSSASKLRKKEKELEPPKDKNDTIMRTMNSKLGRWGGLKLRLRMLLGLRV